MTALGDDLSAYLALRRSLGHDLRDSGRLLPRFVAYLYERGESVVTIENALAWSQESAGPPGTTTRSRRMSAVRGFARFMAAQDPRTQVPPLGLIPFSAKWKPPYVYAPAEIEGLMRACYACIPTRHRAVTYATLIGLLAATGLRIGEAIRLERRDVDWADATLHVRRTKFAKSRLLPLHTSTIAALKTFHRDQAKLHPRSTALFSSLTSKPLLYVTVRETFRTLTLAANIGLDAPRLPRLHDLRHTFAVRTLQAWQEAGDDVHARLPWLSTYMGHADPVSTYWYLSAAPELLQHAALRLSWHERTPS